MTVQMLALAIVVGNTVSGIKFQAASNMHNIFLLKWAVYSRKSS
jgi:hypothetical protein